METPLLYQNIKDLIKYTEGNEAERLAKLSSLVHYSATLCALTEMKEECFDKICKSGEELNCLPMDLCWSTLIWAAISFHEALNLDEWDGEWYECLESYFDDIIKPKLLSV